MKTYINLTSPTSRNESNGQALFVGASSPHSVVSNSTIGRWIKSCLSSAGIDTNVYSAHSTRGSAASKAFANGVSVSSILLNGHWARESTFACFYHRPTINDSGIQDSILQSAGSE